MRARATATSSATRREVEQSITRFEKRLEDANDALKALGSNLGRGASGGYKEMTAALTALRREASKTNKQALKDFDKFRAALSDKTPAASGSKASSSASKKSSGASRSSAKKASRSKSSRSTSKRSTSKPGATKRGAAKRSGSTRARKSS